jgi:bloom syndrome protein
LIYQVRKREKTDKAVADIKRFIEKTYPKQSGIIYCLTQAECESLAKELRSKGILAGHYHAGMTENARNKLHEEWMMNET